MHEITISELLDLVGSEFDDPDHHLQKMYEWFFDRAMSEVRFIFGLAASLLVALLVALFDKELTDDYPDGVLEIGFIMAAFTAIYGFYRFWELRSIHRTYSAGLQLLGELKRLTPFVVRYRESI